MAESVAFRLDGALRKKLDDEAEAHGRSAGQHARQLVISALEGESPARQELASIRAELAKLREELAKPPSSNTPAAEEIGALRDDLLAALRSLPKDLALDTHLVRFMAEYSSTQRELFEKNYAALRRDLANAVRALLVAAGKSSAEEANAWVNAHLRRKD